MEWKTVVPFEPIRGEVIPEGDNWVAQVKWDGVRMLTYCDGMKTQLINRKGNERTAQYPEFVEVSAYCRAKTVILDGEMIAIADGKPSFHEIMRRDSVRREQGIRFAAGQVQAIYMIFDILFADGKWVTDQPLGMRQQLLHELIIPSDRVQVVPNVADGSRLFSIMQERGWEGIVCKKLDSPYLIGGKDGRWQKFKLARDLYAAIGGVTLRGGIVNAILLGVYDREGHFIYIGHAGTGKWKARDWRELTEKISELTVSERPFHNIPERVKGALWVKPTLTVKVEYLEWTPGGTMRHPIIQGWGNVPPEACTVTQNT